MEISTKRWYVLRAYLVILTALKWTMFPELTELPSAGATLAAAFP